MRKLILALLLLPLSALAGTATLTWTAPTTNTDGSAITGAITYKVYGALQGATKVLIGTGTSPYVHSNVAAGTWCYQVTATVGGAESARSNEACKIVPVPVPNPPVLMTVETVAYSVAADWSTLKFVKNNVVGSVALGTLCQSAMVEGGFYRVDTTAVKWSGTSRPANVVVKCG